MRWVATLACVLAASTLASCGGSTPRSHQAQAAAALASWSSGASFAAGITTLLTDSTTVREAIASHDAPKVLHTVCVEMLDDAQGTNNYLPTTDPQLTALLSSAYDQLVNAANACYGGTGSAAALAGADRERHAAVGLLVAAVLREEEVVGRSLHVKGIP